MKTNQLKSSAANSPDDRFPELKLREDEDYEDKYPSLNGLAGGLAGALIAARQQYAPVREAYLNYAPAMVDIPASGGPQLMKAISRAAGATLAGAALGAGAERLMRAMYPSIKHHFSRREDNKA